MGRHHARNLRAIDGVDLVAVADAQGDPHGVAEGLPVLPDIDALLEQNLDYVVIAAPTMYHEEIGLKVAEAGVHALIEKPLAKTFEDAQRLAKAFAAQGLVGAVGHIERYNPALQELPAGAWRRASWVTCTRSAPGGRARSRRASRTSV